KIGTFVTSLTPLPAVSFHLLSCVRWTFLITSLRRNILPIRQCCLAFALSLLLSAVRRYSSIAICRGAATGTIRCHEFSLTRSTWTCYVFSILISLGIETTATLR